MNMNKFNVFAGVLALLYFFILLFPLLKGLFNKKEMLEIQPVNGLKSH